MKTLVLTLVILLLAIPVMAQETITRYDNMGRAYKVDAATANTPGAGSGFGAVIGPQDSTGTFYKPAEFDVWVSFGPQGANDGTANDERAFLDMGAAWYVSPELALGLQIGKPNVAMGDLIEFAPVLKGYLFRGPTDSYLKAIKFRPFGYAMAMTPGGGGYWNWNPRATLAIEWPMRVFSDRPSGSLGIELGLAYAITEFNQDLDEATLLGAITFNWWTTRGGGGE